ncbi:Mitogen-activated protein kinase kinase kinase 9 [Chlorella vulgaris]
MTDASVGCPLATSLPHSWAEHSGPGTQLPDIRAYKLGKKRWSYNQVELVLGEADNGVRTAAIRQDSAVGFHVELESGAKLQAHIFLCYDKHASRSGDCSGGGAATDSSNSDGAAGVAASQHHAWHLVTRKDCCKNCEGRVLRSIQRFGRQAKRCRNGATKPAAGDVAGGSAAAATVSSKKDPRFMYLSLDEACTHVSASAFRLVAGIYNRQGTRLLATSVSPPIRVLANNDVPTGAARFKLEAHLPADWEGWAPQAPQLTPVEPLATSRPRKQAVRAKPFTTAAATQNRNIATLSHPSLPAIRTISLSLNPSGKEALLQPGTKRQAVQQQPQFSELSSYDVWQLPASSLASKLPQPARSREASGHLVCSGGTPHAAAAYASVTDYSHADAASTTLTSFHVGSLTLGAARAAAPHGCREPPINWLAPAGLAEYGNCVPTGDAAAQCEAGRQLDLLSQLKAGLLAASNQEISTDQDAVPAASAAPVAWTAVEPAAPHLAEPLSDGGSALAACWEQEVSQLRASSSAQPSASFVMPQWQPTSHCATPAAESLLMDSFDFGMPDSSRCDFGATVMRRLPALLSAFALLFWSASSQRLACVPEALANDAVSMCSGGHTSGAGLQRAAASLMDICSLQPLQVEQQPGWQWLASPLIAAAATLVTCLCCAHMLRLQAQLNRLQLSSGHEPDSKAAMSGQRQVCSTRDDSAMLRSAPLSNSSQPSAYGKLADGSGDRDLAQERDPAAEEQDTPTGQQVSEGVRLAFTSPFLTAAIRRRPFSQCPSLSPPVSTCASPRDAAACSSRPPRMPEGPAAGHCEGTGPVTPARLSRCGSHSRLAGAAMPRPASMFDLSTLAAASAPSGFERQASALPELMQLVAAYQASCPASAAHSSGSEQAEGPLRRSWEEPAGSRRPMAAQLSTSGSLDPAAAVEEAGEGLGLPLPLLQCLVHPADVEYIHGPDGRLMQLGAGASSRVYKALYNGEIIAAKELEIWQNPELREAFVTEMLLLQHLRHPNVIGYFGVSLTANKGVLLLEYAEGRDLHSALQLTAAGTNERLFGWRRRGRRVAYEVAKGLNYLHSKGVIHMDIKSGNVLLTATGEARLSDVGLSRHAALNTGSAGGGERCIGTFAWMAPELLLDADNACTPACDIYSYGVLLLEILTGERPVRGRLRSPRVPEECPQEVADFAMRCLSIDPQDRPSASQLVSELGMQLLKRAFAADRTTTNLLGSRTGSPAPTPKRRSTDGVALRTLRWEPRRDSLRRSISLNYPLLDAAAQGFEQPSAAAHPGALALPGPDLAPQAPDTDTDPPTPTLSPGAAAAEQLASLSAAQTHQSAATGTRAKPHAPQLCCQVCGTDLRSSRMFNMRFRVCAEHAQAESVVVSGVRQRFCQQCGRFHNIELFDATMRSCREQLAKHAERRRMRRRKQWAAAQAAADGGGGNGGDEAISEGGTPAASELTSDQMGSIAAAAAAAMAAAGGSLPHSWLSPGLHSGGASLPIGGSLPVMPAPLSVATGDAARQKRRRGAERPPVLLRPASSGGAAAAAAAHVRWQQPPPGMLAAGAGSWQAQVQQLLEQQHSNSALPAWPSPAQLQHLAAAAAAGQEPPPHSDLRQSTSALPLWRPQQTAQQAQQSALGLLQEQLELQQSSSALPALGHHQQAAAAAAASRLVDTAAVQRWRGQADACLQQLLLLVEQMPRQLVETQLPALLPAVLQLVEVLAPSQPSPAALATLSPANRPLLLQATAAGAQQQYQQPQPHRQQQFQQPQQQPQQQQFSSSPSLSLPAPAPTLNHLSQQQVSHQAAATGSGSGGAAQGASGPSQRSSGSGNSRDQPPVAPDPAGQATQHTTAPQAQPQPQPLQQQQQQQQQQNAAAGGGLSPAGAAGLPAPDQPSSARAGSLQQQQQASEALQHAQQHHNHHHNQQQQQQQQQQQEVKAEASAPPAPAPAAGGGPAAATPAWQQAASVAATASPAATQGYGAGACPPAGLATPSAATMMPPQLLAALGVLGGGGQQGVAPRLAAGAVDVPRLLADALHMLEGQAVTSQSPSQAPQQQQQQQPAQQPAQQAPSPQAAAMLLLQQHSAALWSQQQAANQAAQQQQAQQQAANQAAQQQQAQSAQQLMALLQRQLAPQQLAAQPQPQAGPQWAPSLAQLQQLLAAALPGVQQHLDSGSLASARSFAANRPGVGGMKTRAARRAAATIVTAALLLSGVAGQVSPLLPTDVFYAAGGLDVLAVGLWLGGTPLGTVTASQRTACEDGFGALGPQQCRLLDSNCSLVPPVAGRDAATSLTAGFPVRAPQLDLPGFTSNVGQGLQGADFGCPASILPGQCAFASPLDAATVCAYMPACRSVVVYANGTDGCSSESVAVLKSSTLTPSNAFLAPSVVTLEKVSDTAVNETYVLASEAQVILPSEAEAAVFEEAHSAGENAEQHTNWLGCFVAAETLMDGEVVSSLSGLVSPEECCRECRADAACNVWSFCERPEGCRYSDVQNNVSLSLGDCQLGYQSLGWPPAVLVKGQGVQFTGGAPLVVSSPPVDGYTRLPGQGLWGQQGFACANTLKLELEECVLNGTLEELAGFCDDDDACVAFVYKPAGLLNSTTDVAHAEGANLDATVMNPSGTLYLRDDVPGNDTADGGGGTAGSSGSTLSAGAVAGIAVGAAAGAFAAALLAWLVWRRRHRRHKAAAAELAKSQSGSDATQSQMFSNGGGPFASSMSAGSSGKPGTQPPSSGVLGGQPSMLSNQPSTPPGWLPPTGLPSWQNPIISPFATNFAPTSSHELAQLYAAGSGLPFTGSGALSPASQHPTSYGESGGAPALCCRRHGSHSWQHTGPAHPRGPSLWLNRTCTAGAGLRDWALPRSDIEYMLRSDGTPLSLGEGASGRVYKALWNGEVVAAKEMDIGRSLEMQHAFVTEARHLVLLRHANVVAFYGCCIDGPRGILLMEFCEGRDLHSVLQLPAAGSQQRLFGWSRRGRRVALEVARALNYLHSKSIVHMDVKSCNVLLSASGTAKLADVGLSRLQTKTVLSDLSLIGTFAWAAPEILLGGTNCTRAVDVYSFGVLLWEIITGERPLRGNLRMPRVPEECPQEIVNLMLECLSPHPAARPSAQQLMQRLSDVVNPGLGGRSSGMLAPTGSLQPPASSLDPPSRPPTA